MSSDRVFEYLNYEDFFGGAVQNIFLRVGLKTNHFDSGQWHISAAGKDAHD